LGSTQISWRPDIVFVDSYNNCRDDDMIPHNFFDAWYEGLQVAAMHRDMNIPINAGHAKELMINEKM